MDVLRRCGAAQEREDSQRRRLAEVLARRCDTLLLLTATPHDGNDRSFASLCELLDPSLVDGRGMLRGERYRPHVVRRLKSHVPGFKTRIVEPRPVIASPTTHPAFVALHRALLDLIAPELRRAFRARRYSDVLAFIALLKRSVSTVAACKTTLTVVAERFQRLLTEGAEEQESRRQRLRTLRDYHRKLERFGTVSPAEEQEQFLLEAEELAQQLAGLQRAVQAGSRSLTRVSTVVQALDELVALADAAERQDPKLQQLAMEIADIRGRYPRANVIVYTEYTDSQQALVQALQDADVDPIVTMCGDDPDNVRIQIADRFRSHDGLVLVSTDAAAEGLNLHERCHHLIHLELPFNPNRLEQRNGRIDRYGQQHDPVVRYLFLRGTFEERILLRLIAKYERQRARLSFVPNTLGLTVSTDVAAERLLKGLMDDDTRLFQDENTPIDFMQAAEDTGMDEVTQELLEEVDRTLKGFEQTTRLHAWLGDLGMNAERQLLAEADRAWMLGDRAGMVDLERFVVDAVWLDGGAVVGSIHDDVFDVQLPAAWSYGLDTLPGYDATTRTLSLTTKLEVMRDARDRPVGFLGRAHPLVRRALDRVRQLSFGGMAQAGQDPRASAVIADVPEPTLLFTFLGRLSSHAGRELERVLAVKVTPQGPPECYPTADQWTLLADPSRAVRTTDIFKNHFEHRFAVASRQARQAAEAGFHPLAETFVHERLDDLHQERTRQHEWLRRRAGELMGEPRLQPVQTELFDPLVQEGSPMMEQPIWATLTDPVEQLAAFAADPTQPVRTRSEADGVLRIHRQRLSALEAQLALGTPVVQPLGVLMLIPEGTTL